MEREKEGTGWHWKNRRFIFYKFCLPHSFNHFIYSTFSYTEFYYSGIGIITCVFSQAEYIWIPAHTPPGTLQHCKTLVQIQMYSTNLLFARAESKLEHTWLKPYKWNSMNIFCLWNAKMFDRIEWRNSNKCAAGVYHIYYFVIFWLNFMVEQLQRFSFLLKRDSVFLPFLFTSFSYRKFEAQLVYSLSNVFYLMVFTHLHLTDKWHTCDR